MAPRQADQTLSTLTSPASANSVQLEDLSRRIHSRTFSRLKLPTACRTGKPRVVVDLSFPRGYSVNTGIPDTTYLGDEFKVRLNGVDSLLDIIRLKGRHCHLFKMVLNRAY